MLDRQALGQSLNAYDASPNIKRKRMKHRGIIVNYRREVDAFCKRWRLKAWWAVPLTPVTTLPVLRTDAACLPRIGDTRKPDTSGRLPRNEHRWTA